MNELGQFGPHRWSPGYHGADERFRGTTFMVADLRGARFVDCDLTGVKIVDAALVDVDISGWVSNLVVNGVDVTEYVEAELDRRHPERVQLREIQDADGFRAMWATLDGLWSELTARAERLPESARHERVAGEWSFVETLRHLIWITDSWVSRTILDQERPFHPLALPQTAYNPADAATLGMDLDAKPTYAEVVEARADRQAVVNAILEDLTNADLGRPCPRPPAPGYPEEDRAVADCLGVLMDEEAEHYRFALRDLTTLESRQ
ncbi:DinB family protein [Kribbella sp. NPDC050820]|uniref:DinB family protein n=1 Tax=Kribbella sp. NPDC050820 TaxID=3155408 RepID=UPI0033E73232